MKSTISRSKSIEEAILSVLALERRPIPIDYLYQKISGLDLNIKPSYVIIKNYMNTSSLKHLLEFKYINGSYCVRLTRSGRQVTRRMNTRKGSIN